VVDIIKHKQVLEALRRARKKHRLLFENSRNALMTLAPPSWKFTSANRATLRMFGAASEAEFTCLGPWDISPEQQPDGLASAEKAKQVIETAMREGSYFFEWTHKRLDGRTFPAEVLLTRMEQQDGQVSIQATVRDITERKRLEKEILERRNEMENLQKLHVAAQTAAAIAHELNQPLLAIASYSEAALILLKAEKPNLDKVRKAIEGSELQAHRAGQSIRELLEFLSTKDFPNEAIDLNKEILDVLDTARSEHELQFQSVLQLEEGLPLVRANRTHVQKVLLNLLHNGIEAMQEAGVPLPCITVTVRTINDKAVAQVTIQDNGPGIKKEDSQRLFEPFFTTKARGIGMGLAVSRSLIEANGGQLWVDPQENPGATFHLTLPFAT
jgi:PAS domain S-box-containing protein